MKYIFFALMIELIAAAGVACEDPKPGLPFIISTSPLSYLNQKPNLALDIPVGTASWLGFKGSYFSNSALASLDAGSMEEVTSQIQVHGLELGIRYTYIAVPDQEIWIFNTDFIYRGGFYLQKENEGAWDHSGESTFSKLEPALEAMAGLRVHYNKLVNFDALGGLGQKLASSGLGKDNGGGGLLLEFNYVFRFP